MKILKYAISIAGGTGAAVIGLGVIGAAMMPDKQPRRDAVAMLAGSVATALLLWNINP